MNINRNSPIGLIDSGIGGITLLKQLSKKYPNESYIYLADNQNMPYGNKSAKFLKNRLLGLINYLYDNYNIKLVILACNTASSSALEYLQKNAPVKVLGLDLNILVTDNYQILCTRLSSKQYKHLNTYSPNRLATMIEENIFDKTALTKRISKVMSNIDNLTNNIILGCTHYELVASTFIKLYPNKNFILPCKEFVKSLKLESQNINTNGSILMISTIATKSYIDKLWKIYKS